MNLDELMFHLNTLFTSTLHKNVNLDLGNDLK